jgi:acyl-CoA synthetase (AMP-forming)/AMP-acid ligase II
VQLYTSGTTGFPKGAMLTHRAMAAHARNVAASFDIGPDARVQVAMPLYHVGGTSYALLVLSCGAHIVMLRMPDPAAVAETLETERITHTFLVPALLAAMTQVPGLAERDFSQLRGLSYGASPMPLPVMRACLELFPGVMNQVYGMTEACGVVCSLGPEDHENPAVQHRLVSAGTPIHGAEIEIRDPATGEPVPTGEPGEIWVRTEQIMGGYWGRPDATAATITPDGWLRSGDGGHMDADGYLYVTDRIKDMIVSGGENIYPAEIERVLAEHPTVDDVAVIGVPDERWGEVPKAVVVAAMGAATVDPDALIAYCREHLAAFKCPKSVDVVDELPRNLTGKILKKQLREPYWQGRERRIV